MSFDDQSTYQVRAEWGVAGLRRLAPADIVIVVDALRFTTTVTDRVAAGDVVPLDDDAFAVSINGAVVAAAAADTGAIVLAGSLRNAKAVADAVLAIQHERAARTSIAVIACGERVSRDSAEVRFAVEDQLAAGAIISALSDLGIDHTSPDAAVMGEGARALSRACVHLFLASASGRELVEMGRRDEVVSAATRDAIDAVAILRDGVFEALVTN
ncbi:2-phosphosulfolactate phosphatase [Microbacterium sp. YY-03]|uniref:2-phosphosulfolactate phosphatase n=1 Tax=unclassified Microbacterium TaxID=2609290 RepID=UPI001C2CBB64|nr:2-phosphosulfolactate phosphatase [Microbacterium sp. NC79]MBV0893941.1 2-phosphosulfolactate phosphatase [Microbacterium sp. NC79]